MDVEEVSTLAVDCCYKVYQGLGPGMLETAYESVLTHRLRERALFVERQKTIPIRVGDLVIDEGFRADLVVESKLLIELKSVERLSPVYGKQVLTYLRFLDLRMGLLMNFGAGTFREGMRRIVNGHENTAGSPLKVNHNQ